MATTPILGWVEGWARGPVYSVPFDLQGTTGWKSYRRRQRGEVLSATVYPFYDINIWLWKPSLWDRVIFNGYATSVAEWEVTGADEILQSHNGVTWRCLTSGLASLRADLPWYSHFLRRMSAFYKLFVVFQGMLWNIKLYLLVAGYTHLGEVVISVWTNRPCFHYVHTRT